MPKELHEINDLIDPIAESMSVVVSDKATQNGTGFASMLAVLAQYKAVGGIQIDFGTPNPAAIILDAIQTPQTIINWEGAMPVQKDTATDLAAGTITIQKAGTYLVYANLAIEYNITDKIAMQFEIDGVPSSSHSVAGFRNNQVDTQNMALLSAHTLAVGEVVSVSIFADAVGGSAVVLAGQLMLTRLF